MKNSDFGKNAKNTYKTTAEQCAFDRGNMISERKYIYP
jgi:hypothetical protein